MTKKQWPLASVKLLFPCDPGMILAVGLNYKSHLKGRTLPARPDLFFKLSTALQTPADPIIIPREACNVHFGANW